MKTTITKPVEIEITTIQIDVPVRYGDEDIPFDFPLRAGDEWSATVDVDTGRIKGWPNGKSGSLYMKVCDEGVYTLFDPNGVELAERSDYVPHGVVPGEDGDYISLEIDADGIITNWPKRPTFNAFFNKGEQ